MFGLIRLGDRLRAAGSAEIADFDATPMPARVQAILDKVLQTFPQFARCYSPGTAKVWAGFSFACLSQCSKRNSMDCENIML